MYARNRRIVDTRRTLRKRKIVPAISALLFATAAVSGQSIDIDTFISGVVETSIEVERAREAVVEAAEALERRISFDASKISLSGGYNYRTVSDKQVADAQAAGVAEPTPHNPSASGSLTLPLIPQLSLKGDFSTDFNEVSSSFSVSISPLAAGAVTYREWDTYEKAQILLVSSVTSLPYQVESKALAYVVAEQNLESAKAKLAYETERYRILEPRYEVGEATWSELDGVRSALSSAERSVLDSERSLLTSRRQLIDVAGPDLGTATLAAPTIHDLETRIDERKSYIRSASLEPTTASLLTPQSDLRRLERQLDETPFSIRRFRSPQI